MTTFPTSFRAGDLCLPFHRWAHGTWNRAGWLVGSQEIPATCVNN